MIRLLHCLAAIACLAILTTDSSAQTKTLPPAPEGSFSIVVIPDTQAYRKVTSEPNGEATIANPIFEAHTRWIVDNIESHRIVFVSHVGDIVDKNIDEQWTVARHCMDRVHGRIPYGISVGNHDMTSQGDSSLFQKYFGRDRYKGFSWYGGAYEGNVDGSHISGNNANSYQLFSAGGMDFIFLHLECNAPDDVLQWANHVLESHPDRRAFITTHMGWGPKQHPERPDDFFSAEKGRMQWSKIHGPRGNTPQQLWEKCYQRHANLVAVFSGDQSRTQAYDAATPGRHGNTVHELLQDYSRGWLRLYRFLPTENRVEAWTFNPNTEELCTETKVVRDPRRHQFSFEYQMAD